MLKLKKHLAPIKVAVIPLKKNNEAIMNKCHEIKQNLLKLGIGRVALENTGNIGKAYRRHDEVGTPLCITVALILPTCRLISANTSFNKKPLGKGLFI